MQAGWVVLTLPPGDFTLDRRLALNRSQTVLRGAGSGATRLLLPHSLMELYGEEGWGPTSNRGMSVWHRRKGGRKGGMQLGMQLG